ncbi:MAG: STAS domain-containing protein [Actinomycetia bacterium]|nr:STAS domain-containing protein [Actinomycetes bacterium]
MDAFSTSVTTRSAGGETYVIIGLAGGADATSSEKLRKVLDGEIGQRPSTIVLDLSELTFLDSTALHVVLRANRTLDRYGCVLALAGPTEAVATVLKMTATDQLIPVYGSVREATEGP